MRWSYIVAKKVMLSDVILILFALVASIPHVG